METDDFERMPDAQLLAALKTLVATERQGLVRILRHLAEVDRRDLPQKTGYSSLFMFCLGELGYSEGAAYRIQPFALGGRSDDPDNLRLRCQAHNLLTAREVFSQDVVPRRAASS